ncbi:MAG TPA: FHA domain-containing protein [Anaerolineae bacterium]|nr:FHA domain-containing protein [Anaerolineae bacterium]
MEENAILLVLEGDTTRKNWELNKPTILIGRGNDCDVVVNDRQVSRHHAQIVRDDTGYKLVDLNSKNGTFLNGQQLMGETRPLKDGDQIGIALSCRLVFVDADATAPLAGFSAPQTALRMDRAAKRVWVAGQEVNPPLSLAQYTLLELLFEHDGGVVSREEIVSRVWADEAAEGVSEQAIDALARRLRERLAEIDPDTQYVITVRGHGFRLEHFVREN